MKYAGTFRESGHDRNHSRCILSYRGFAELPFWQVWFLVLPKTVPLLQSSRFGKGGRKWILSFSFFLNLPKTKRRKALELLSFLFSSQHYSWEFLFDETRMWRKKRRAIFEKSVSTILGKNLCLAIWTYLNRLGCMAR